MAEDNISYISLGEANIPCAVELLARFHRSSHLAEEVQFCPQKTSATLKAVIQYGVGFIAWDNVTDEGVGLALFQIGCFYAIEAIAMEDVFYIVPEYRNKLVADGLMQVCLEALGKNEVCLVYSSSTGEVDDKGVAQRAYGWLMARHGFKEVKYSRFFIKKLFDSPARIKDGEE